MRILWTKRESAVDETIDESEQVRNVAMAMICWPRVVRGRWIACGWAVIIVVTGHVHASSAYQSCFLTRGCARACQEQEWYVWPPRRRSARRTRGRRALRPRRQAAKYSWETRNSRRQTRESDVRPARRLATSLSRAAATRLC
jgi:hypothetical protein